jgi:hypothetical protein
MKKILLLFLLFTAGTAFSAIWNSDGSQANVQALHDQAATHDGDTITLPAGTYTWNVPVRFTKAINVVGAGIGVTTINDNVSKTPPPPGVLWSFTLPANSNVRVTGFTIFGQAQDTSGGNAGTLNFGGYAHTFRVDHIQFLQPGSSCIGIDGDLWGVIDHCYFEGAFRQGVHVTHGNWNGDTGGWGDGSYEDPLHLGTERAVYIEDCTFNGESTGGGIDGTRGGRVVFRYNTVTGANIGWHGTEGSRQRGMRSIEVYQNTFSETDGIIFTGVLWRSGTGVIWGNTFTGGTGQTGFHDMMLVTTYRDFNCGGVNGELPWGNINGSNPWDKNDLPNGYPALDQVGRGTCQDQIRGDTPVNTRTGNPAWPNQAEEPVYEWNNTWSPVPQNTGPKVGFQCDIVQLGRDVFTDTPMPGYTPYVYPHPLVSGASPSPTPTATATPTPPPTPSKIF